MIRSPIARTGTLKPARTRKCAVKGCGNRFQPRNMTHKVCGPDCGAVFAVAERQRLDAKQTREAKAKLKTRTEHLADAQAVFNRYIRARDEALPCISCGRHHTGAWDAGHYRSVGAQPALRFHEDNTHKQCVPCNQHKGGNAIEYRIGLRTRIGDERLEFLEREHPPAKYTIDDAKRIKAEYASRLKQIKLNSI
jgi:hypothetical protein